MSPVPVRRSGRDRKPPAWISSGLYDISAIGTTSVGHTITEEHSKPTAEWQEKAEYITSLARTPLFSGLQREAALAILDIYNLTCELYKVHNVHVNPSVISNQIIGLKSEVPDKESQEIPEIQDIIKIPLNEQEVIKAPVVVFDLETTGLSRKSDITQIAAFSKSVNFSTYIFPSQPISKEASEVTQIFVNGNKMFHNSTAVQYKLAHEALTDFIIFLSSFPHKCILVGHNIKSFDTHVLYNQLRIYNMWNEFCLHVCAFCDTLDLFKSVVPGMSSYSQTSLVKELLGETYDAHNAIHDTKVLYKLVIERGNFQDNVVKFSLPVSYPDDSHVIQ
ncbi:Hypothetical predicted protein [Mytilus galloprovincialis]|uniref:Exonuclease domain-containing protein n=1 Tax=Mytilus galloprovincialis TaxID=29158 RepID=A0A8B6CK09_MYTGA|nr:Hypothetical predicted protein [Mytilus galloprovincialis]